MSSKGDASSSEQGPSNRVSASSLPESPARSTNMTLRTSVDKLVQTARTSLKGAAKTARAKLAAKQAERYAKQRAREIREIRSRLIGFSDGGEPKPLSSLGQTDQQKIAQNDQHGTSQLSMTEVWSETAEERQLRLEPFMKQLEEFNLKVQEFEVEQIANARTESGSKAAELALLAAQADIDQKVRELEALNEARVTDEEKRKQTELALLEARKEVEAKAQELDAVCKAKVSVEERRNEAELALVSAQEELEKRAQAVARHQEAKLHAEEELGRTKAALFLLKEESEKNARELAAEKNTRTRIQEERKQLELAVAKTQKVVRKKEQEISEEREARVKAEKELQRALEMIKTTVTPDPEIPEVDLEASRMEEVKAEHQARLKAEQEWQQGRQELLTVQDEVKRKSNQLEQERLERSALQEQLKLTQSSLLQAEADAKNIANEIEAQRRSRFEAEQQLQQLETRVLELQQEKERKLIEAANKEAEAQAEVDRKNAEEVQVRLDPKLSTASIRTCPSCRRVFSASQEYCLFDATRLVDGPQRVNPVLAERSKVLNWPIVSLILLTFVGTGVVGVVAINYFSSRSSSAASSPLPLKRNETQHIEEPVVGGALAGKGVLLVRPEYPAAARNRGISGRVQVAVLVDIDGTVKQARAVEGAPLLRAPAVEAALKTKFEAEKLAQQRGLTSGTITYNFQLGSQPQ